MSTPARPPGVPLSARFVAENGEGFRWVDGPVDDDGKPHGASTIYADAGYRRNTLSSDHGVQHGLSTVFHPDGAVASTGDWRHGTLFDAVYFRAKTESPEPFPADVDARVASVRYVSRDGKANHQVLYFDAEGNEVTNTGEPMPARPASVEADARYFPKRKQWLLGAVKRGPEAKRVGPHTEWTREGVLVSADVYDDEGEVVRRHSYFPDGSTERLDVYVGDVRTTRERYRSPGVLSERVVRDAQGRPLLEAEYAKDGSLREERTWNYDDAGLVHHVERGRAGAPLFEVERDGEAMKVSLHDGGHLLAQGLVRGDRLVGVWRVFDTDGTTRTEADLSAYESETKLERFPVYRALQRALARHLEPQLPAFPSAQAIDWSTLATCSGTAKGFERHLRALGASEPIVRHFALGQLLSQVEHQGSVYPATATVAPLLLEALERPGVDREALLEALITMAQAAAGGVAEAEASLAKDSARLAGSDGDWRYAIVETLEAVGNGWPRLKQVLTSGSPKEQGLVVALAGLARGKELRAEVLAVATSTTSVTLKATAIDALAGLAGMDPALLAPWLSDDDRLVRASTAIALGLRFGPKAPPQTSHALAEAVTTFETWRVGFQALPFVSGNALGALALAVGSVRSDECFGLATPLLELMKATDGVTATAAGRGVLALALGRCKPPFMPGFVEVLRGLSTCEPFFAFNVNAAEVLRDFGVACTAMNAKEQLAALVATLVEAPDPTAAFMTRLS